MVRVEVVRGADTTCAVLEDIFDITGKTGDKDARDRAPEFAFFGTLLFLAMYGIQRLTGLYIPTN